MNARLAVLAVLSLALAPLASFAQSSTTNPAVPPRTIANIIAVLDQYKPDPEKAKAMLAQAEREPSSDANNSELIAFLRQRAAVREELGLTSLWLEDKRKLVELAQNERDKVAALTFLAGAERTAGNLGTAVAIRQTIQNNPGAALSTKRMNAYSLAELYAQQGDLANARRFITIGDAIFERNRNAPFWNTSPVARTGGVRESANALVFRGEGKLLEAETAVRRSMAFHAQDLLDRPQEADTNGFDGRELDLTRYLIELGRLAEAELAVRNVLTRTLSRSGKYAPVTAYATVVYAQVLTQQGRFREAEVMARATLDICDQIGLSANSNRRLAATKELGDSFIGREDWVNANAQYVARQTTAQADEYNRRLVGGSVEGMLAAIKVGDSARALPILKTLLEKNVKDLGQGHYQTGETRGTYAIAMAASGDQAAALANFRDAMRVLLSPEASSTQSDALALRRVKLRNIIDAYLTLLWQIKGSDLEKRAGLNAVAESFRLADAARAGSVQQSLAASAARAAANQPGLGELIRQEQDERQEIQVLYETLLRLVGLPPEQQLPKIMTDMRARIADIEKNRTRLFAEIEKLFPDYANVSHPRPATPEQAAKALRPGEVLVSVLSTRERSFVWTITAQGGISYHSAELGEPEIARIVENLRKSLDYGSLPLAQVPAYDFAGAHRLYMALFAPSLTAWGGATTMVTSVSGGLAQIPLAILTTENVQPKRDANMTFGEFRGVPWLARKVAVVSIPSVSAFVRLRAIPAANSARQPFIGFGDPQFTRVAEAKTAPQAATVTRGFLKVRNLSIARMSETGDAVHAQRPATEGASVQAGSAVTASDWTAYGDLNPLPDTRDEILAIAQALGADKLKDVYLGSDANRKTVQTVSMDKRRIVAFATHGLIPGDLPGLVQPALALAAFDDPTVSPLLTLDDVLALKLDADLVVLSACNTAAGDGEGAEAVSGLGRGFFYAGSRSLLVTHWPVETVSARMLTTGMFERYTKDPTLSRALALNRSLLSIMDQNALDAAGRPEFSYAHPLFWAPYALIGDGGR